MHSNLPIFFDAESRKKRTTEKEQSFFSLFDTQKGILFKPPDASPKAPNCPPKCAQLTFYCKEEIESSANSQSAGLEIGAKEGGKPRVSQKTLSR